MNYEELRCRSKELNYARNEEMNYAQNELYYTRSAKFN